MKRSFTVKSAVLAVLVSLLAVVGGVAAPAAHASCPPPDSSAQYIYKFANKTTTYHSTNLASDWVYWPQGGSINYTKNTTGTTSASVTATVSAEAGVIFAKASTSFGITVGKTWSKSQVWSYTANVPSGTGYRYRLHMYHYSLNFDVMKKTWSYGTCGYINYWSSWQHVAHAPVASSSNIWRLDRASI
ncbi:hypothetical protein [Nocardioides montaniterrae]